MRRRLMMGRAVCAARASIPTRFLSLILLTVVHRDPSHHDAFMAARMRGFTSLLLIIVASLSLSGLVNQYIFQQTAGMAEVVVARAVTQNSSLAADDVQAQEVTQVSTEKRFTDEVPANLSVVESQPISLVQESRSPEPVTSLISNATEKPLWQAGIYDGPLCPGLLKAAHFIANSTIQYPKLNVTMFQLVGSWSDNETRDVYQNVYNHNVRVGTRHGYTPTAVTNTSKWARHPAFAKVLALRDYCLKEQSDLIWFLDGDVVLMNPYIPIELLWFYYQAKHPEMDFLFACDNNDLNSGVFIVNCTAPTALRLLEYWDYYGEIVNSWHNTLGSMYEQNAIHWLVQTPFWRQYHPRLKRRKQLSHPNARNNREELMLFSVRKLQERVIVIDQICELSVFPIEFMCDATYEPRYLTRGPRWWEEGHFALHTAGTRNPFRRLPYLGNFIKKAADLSIPPPVATVQEAALEYLQHYGSRKSIDPTRNIFDFDKCRREERQANRRWNAKDARGSGSTF
jgi:hypothetical protein